MSTARLSRRAGAAAAAVVICTGLGAGGLAAQAATHNATAPSATTHNGPAHETTAGCVLRGQAGAAISHVIYLQFDNVHYTRDTPDVPSDLQQMPNLLKFLTGNGTLISHEHTPLIAHTADDIVTSETGLYGSDQGVPIANEYRYYKPGGRTDTAGSFGYWTDPIVDYDTGLTSKPVDDKSPMMITQNGRNTPALGFLIPAQGATSGP